MNMTFMKFMKFVMVVMFFMMIMMFFRPSKIGGQRANGKTAYRTDEGVTDRTF